MRFYILSDFHLRVDPNSLLNENLLKLCEHIRKETNIDEQILFVILGDIIDQGDISAFDTALAVFTALKNELADYRFNIEFVPGNHDLVNKSLSSFDTFISNFGCENHFDNTSVYSKVYEDINFIFADSNLYRDYSKPGRLDIDAVSKNTKTGMTNILFCHHAISHSQGSLHDTIEKSTDILNKLQLMGISFFFNGHVHNSNITIPNKGPIEISCGSISGNTYFFKNVFNQFIVGYIDDKQIKSIERCIPTEDGGGFAKTTLYPKNKSFDDPLTIRKIPYDPQSDYISRTIIPYEYNNIELLDSNNSLENLLSKHKRILLLCDAGIGKSYELQNIAYKLSSRYHTQLFRLSYYTGQNIEDLLPEIYRDLSDHSIALILDGYDEINSNYIETFKSKLNLYLESKKDIIIVISSRTNFCSIETNNTSKIFKDFFVCHLNNLDYADVINFLNNKNIDASSFIENAKSKNIYDLLFKPFYLNELVKLYQSNKRLPSKNNIMRSIILNRFSEDDAKFSNSLHEQAYDIMLLLEKLAFSMQYMHKEYLYDKDEYQALFNYDERCLIKKSGIFIYEQSTYKFVHNNFREYLAACLLAKLEKETVIPIIYDGTQIKPSWVNTVSYLSSFDINWDIAKWLGENSPFMLSKFEKDKVDKKIIINSFKALFNNYESLNIYFNYNICDINEFIDFYACKETLLFLIDKIKNPVNSFSQNLALYIIMYFPELYGYDIVVAEVLVNCFENYPKSNETICRLAITALCRHNLYSKEITCSLMNKFQYNTNDEIRCGLYNYISKFDLQNTYVEFLLSGIKLIAYDIKDRNKTRLGDEIFLLNKCLKAVSDKKSIIAVINYFTDNIRLHFYDLTNLLKEVISSAIKIYTITDTDLYKALLSFSYKAISNYMYSIQDIVIEFFSKTKTANTAYVDIANEFSEDLYFISHFIYKCPSSIMYIKNAYERGELKTNSLFHNIVCKFVSDEDEYNEYAALINSIEGIKIPDFIKPVNYNKLKYDSCQQYFDILLNKDKLYTLANTLVKNLNDDELTISDVYDLHKYEHYSMLHYLVDDLFINYEYNLVKDVIKIVETDVFTVFSVSRLITNCPNLRLSKTSINLICKLLDRIIDSNTFNNSIEYQKDGNGYIIKEIIPKLLQLIIYSGFNLESEALLELTELPERIFDDNHINKYDFISRNISYDKIRDRLILNIKRQGVKDTILHDHIRFFDKNKDDSIVDEVLKLFIESKDNNLKSISWRYLYNTCGIDYICDNILPIADEDILLAIDNTCSSVIQKLSNTQNYYKSKMIEALKREYLKKPSTLLQNRLIKYEDSRAINDFIETVKKIACLPKASIDYSSDICRAFSYIKSPDYLPKLEELLVIVLNPKFIDYELHEIRDSLIEALTHCAMIRYDETIEIINRNKPSINEDPYNYEYCVRIIENINYLYAFKKDTPHTMKETKGFIKTQLNDM